MRIGIDARTILNPEHSDTIGSGHYTYQLIRHILDLDEENEYVLFFDYRVREKDVKKFTRKNTTIRFYPFSDYKKYLPGAYSEILGSATLSRESLDVLHSTSPLSRIPARYGGKTITTIHNLGVFEYPDLYPQMRRMRERALIRFMTRKSTHLIASSSYIASELKNKFETQEERVSVIPAGVDKRFFETPLTDGSKFRSQHNINRPYIFYLGTLSPINNISRLLEAFASFQSLRPENKEYQLVIAGKRGWLANEYKRIAKDLDIGASVVFTGYVVGDELVPLFKNAECFVLPSLYEGFGSTVLEALATGTPTIASRITSLSEIAGDAVKFFNPLDVKELAKDMDVFVGNKTFREEYIAKGPEQARKYTWEETAQKTLEIYKKVYGQ